MIISCGIIGLPNIGKSTLFNYLTSNNIKAENYPFCTITQHVGTIKIFNNKLNTLSNIINNKQTIYQTMSFIDIAGLVKGSNNGEGLGNQFLSNIKNVQTICHLVRCFEDKQISHIDTTINPIRDIKTIETELILADYSFIEKKIKKDKKNTKFISYCKQLLKHLNKGSKAQTFKYDKTNHELSKYINDMNLLTNKPNYFIANVNLNTMLGKSNTHLNNVKNFLKNRNDNIYSICANIATKSSYATNKKTYNYLINKTKYTIKDIIEKNLKLLNLITYLTIGKKEIKAWIIRKNTNAIQAAKMIHNDIQQGFIKSDVIHWKDFIKYKSIIKCKRAGIVKLKGKTYKIQNGDIIYFRFNI